MTIQFQCPYCTTAVEVDDSAAGKIGRCPKCASRVPVPAVAVVAVAEPLSVETAAPPAPAFDFTVMGRGELPAVSSVAAATGSVSRRVRRQSRSAWWIPAVFGLAFVGVLVWLTNPQWFSFAPTGQLAGVAMNSADLNPVLVSCSGTPLSDEQRASLLEELEHEPVILSGDLMQVQIRGSQRGLMVSIRPGRKTQWYRVDARSNPDLVKYAADHVTELEEPRQLAVEKSLSRFLEQAERITAGKGSKSELAPYRDQLALPALVHGLGYHVTAQVNQALYPCVRETDDGALYFLMPAGVQQFRLVGRKRPDGTQPFQGEYDVIVAAAVSADPEPEPEPEPESKTPSDSGSTDESMDAMPAGRDPTAD